MNNKILSGFVALLIVVVIAGGLWFFSQAEKPVVPEVDGIVLHPARQIKDFAFKDHNNKEFSAASLLGSWHLMFFGYTHCPDVCSPTLNTLNTAYKSLSDSDREMISVVFVSVDPRRDTAEALGRYMSHFNDDFIGVMTTDENLKYFTQQLGVAYARAGAGETNAEKNGQSSGDDNYLVDHTARILVFNPRAELQAYLRQSGSAKDLLADIRKVQHFYNDIRRDE